MGGRSGHQGPGSAPRKKTLIGVDEVGTGALAGPIFVGAVRVVDFRSAWPLQIRESKQVRGTDALTRLYNEIVEYLPENAWAVRAVSAATINEVGVQAAWERAAGEAVRAVTVECGVQHDRLLVDGDRGIPGIGRQETIVGGDSKLWVCAAASILARKHQQEWFKYSGIQGYRWGNSGAGTPEHIADLLAKGPSPEHRTRAVQTALSHTR